MLQSSTTTPDASSIVITSFEPLITGFGGLAVIGASVAALFFFWEHVGRRRTDTGKQFASFALIVAISVSLFASTTLQNWWFFATALTVLPALHLARWTVGRALVTQSNH